MKSFLAPLLLALGCGSVHAQENSVWVVSAKSAKCVVENKTQYLASPQEVLMLIMSACPEVDPTKALSSLTQNTALPGVGVGEAGAQEDIIFYTKEELACVATMNFDFDGETVEWPKEPKC